MKRGRLNRNKATQHGFDDGKLSTTRSTADEAALSIRERQHNEAELALDAVLERRERARRVQHTTYLAQRRAKPKAYREHLKRLAELEEGLVQPTGEESAQVVTHEMLAEMVGFDGDHQKYSLSDYTRFATKAVEIRNRLRQEKGEDKPKSRVRQFLEPLWKADEIIADEEDEMRVQKG